MSLPYWMRLPIAALCTIFLLILIPGSIRAQSRETASKRIFVVICDALTLEDLRTNENANLAAFAEGGAVGMMNCALSGPKNQLSVLLTMSVGEPAAAEPTDAQAANDEESVPGEPDTAAVVYGRRTGQSVVRSRRITVRQLGIAPLQRRGFASRCLGAVLRAAHPPLSTFICGNADATTRDRSGALLTLDAKGEGRGNLTSLRTDPDSPFGVKDDPIALGQMALESEAAFAVIQLGDTARAEAKRAMLSTAAYRSARSAALRRLNILIYYLTGEIKREGIVADVLLVCPCPPGRDAQHPNLWDRLTPLVASGPDFPPGLLTSATTRTAGLVADYDLVPTILHLFQVAPPATDVGRILESVPGPSSAAERLARIARVDFLATLNARAQATIMLVLGILCFLLALAASLARRYGGASRARPLALGILFTQNMGAATLLATLLVPPTLVEYGLRIAAWMAILTVCCYLLAVRLRIGPPVIAAALALLLIVFDSFIGQPLVKDAIFSSYALSGIRYYGIGNEYLGVVLGFAIAGGFAWLDDMHVPLPPPSGQGALNRAPLPWQCRTLAALWILLALILGWPGLGANAGSLAVTGASFGVGIAILLGRRPTLPLALSCLLVGLALAFAFGALEVALAPHTAVTETPVSHVGGAIRAASGARGIGYLLEIIVRKLQMNVRLFFAFWFVVAASTVGTAIALTYLLAGEAIRVMFHRRPWSSRGMASVLAAVVASLIFKDSGVVTVAYLVGATGAVHVYYALITEEAPASPLQSTDPARGVIDET